jgi:hypothetical protein
VTSDALFFAFHAVFGNAAGTCCGDDDIITGRQSAGVATLKASAVWSAITTREEFIEIASQAERIIDVVRMILSDL